MILLIFLVWGALGAELNPEGYLPRHNLGVVFKAEPTPLVMGTETLDLTLVMPYSLRPPTRRDCNFTIDQYVRNSVFTEVMKTQLETLHDEAFDRAFNVFSDLNNTLSAPIFDRVARKKRQAVQFFTGVGTGFLGLATQGNLEKVVAHIMEVDQALNRRQVEKIDSDNVLLRLSRVQASIVSSLKTQKDTFQNIFANLSSSLKANRKAITTVLDRIVRHTQAERHVTLAFLARISETLALNTYYEEHFKFHNAIFMAMHGKLSNHLATHDELSNIMGQAQHFIDSMHLQHDIEPFPVHDVLNLEITAFKYSDTNLYIHVNVPLIGRSNTFSLWRMHAFPVPFHTNDPSQEGFTKVVNQETFLGINDKESLFVELSKSDVAMTEKYGKYIFAKTIFTIRPMSNSTCLSAMWRNDMAYIKLCRIMAFPLIPAPDFALALYKNVYALSISSLTVELTCMADTKLTVAPCALCIVKIPCGCTLRTKQIYVQSSFMACNNETALTVLLHPLNLPVAMAFNMSVHAWDLDDGHNVPISLDLPNFTKIFNEMPGFSKEDVAKGIELSALAAAVVAQDNLVAAKFDWDSLGDTLANPAVFAAIFIIQILTLAALTYVFFRVHVLATPVPFVATGHAVSVKAKQFLHFTRPPTPNKASDMTLEISIDYLEHVPTMIFALLLLCFLITFLRWVFKCYKRQKKSTLKSNPTLFLKVVGNSANLLIKLIQFDHEFNTLAFLSGPSLDKLSFGTNGHISCVWATPLTYKLSGNTKSLDLPTNILVPFALFHALKRLVGADPRFNSYLVVKSPFTTPFEIYSTTQTNNVASVGDLAPAEPSQVPTPSAPKPENPQFEGSYSRLLQAVTILKRDQTWAEF